MNYGHKTNSTAQTTLFPRPHPHQPTPRTETIQEQIIKIHITLRINTETTYQKVIK